MSRNAEHRVVDIVPMVRLTDTRASSRVSEADLQKACVGGS